MTPHPDTRPSPEAVLSRTMTREDQLARYGQVRYRLTDDVTVVMTDHPFHLYIEDPNHV